MIKTKAILNGLVIAIGCILLLFWLLHLIEGVFFTAPPGFSGLNNHVSSLFTYLESTPSGIYVRHRATPLVWSWFIGWFVLGIALAVIGTRGIRSRGP